MRFAIIEKPSRRPYAISSQQDHHVLTTAFFKVAMRFAKKKAP